MNGLPLTGSSVGLSLTGSTTISLLSDFFVIPRFLSERSCSPCPDMKLFLFPDNHNKKIPLLCSVNEIYKRMPDIKDAKKVQTSGFRT